MKKTKYVLSMIFILMVMNACNMAPSRKLVKNEYEIPDKFNQSNTFVEQDSVIRSAWWFSFKDDSLNVFMDKVIKENLDIKLAISRVKQLESNFKQARSQRLPALSVNGSATKNERPIFMGLFEGKIDQTEYSLNTGISFDPDLWGKLNHLENAAIAELKASKYDLQSMYFGITAQAAVLYYEIQARSLQLQIINELVNTYDQDLLLAKLRYERGVGSKLILEITRQTLAGAKIQQIRDRQLLVFYQHQMSVLAGFYPENQFLQQKTDEPISIVFDSVPVGLPSSLLKRRGDILSAENKLEAARQRIGAARADFFPSLSLTATFGYLSKEITDLFNSDFQATSLSAGVKGFYPIGGKTGALNQSWALYEQAEYSYRKTILNAFREVEDALLTLQSSNEKLIQLNEQLDASSQALRLREQQYLQGVGEYDRLLESKFSFFNTKYALVSAKKDLVQGRISLHRALGGSWEE